MLSRQKQYPHEKCSSSQEAEGKTSFFDNMKSHQVAFLGWPGKWIGSTVHLLQNSKFLECN